jgi:hypothetical protein
MGMGNNDHGGLGQNQYKDIHHQFKYLVLHGNKFQMVFWYLLLLMQLKLMEHYGHGGYNEMDN